MKVAIRADASTRMGSGHIRRCLALAQALRRHGATVTFVSRAWPGHQLHSLRREGFGVEELPPPANPVLEQAADAFATIDRLKYTHPDWLVVDHYELDATWETALRLHVKRLMVIDDLANRPHDCDILLDQTLTDTPGEVRYRGLLPAQCATLFGPRFALLSEEYARYRRTARPQLDNIQRVLVSMGGSDLDDATGLAVRAMSERDLAGLELDVVVGANYPHRERLLGLASTRGRTTVRGPLPSLTEAMAGAHLAVGAGGSTSWERLCFGLPAVLVSIADNQAPSCRGLHAAGLAFYAGDAAALTPGTLAAVIRDAVSRLERLRRMSRDAWSTVDGLGAPRVATRLLDAI